MAVVGAVYDITPIARSAADVLATGDQRVPAPSATNRWLTASVVDDAAAVLAAVFDE